MEIFSIKKSKLKKLIILFFIGLIYSSVQAQSTQTNLSTHTTTDSRTSSVKESCSGIPRNSLPVKQSQKTPAIQTFLRNYFNIDGAKVIRNVIIGDTDAWKSEVNSNFGPVFMMIFPFAIGAFVTIVLAPFLFCCLCCRPWCCRGLRFWAKDDSDWGRWQLLCPKLISMILLLGIISGSIIGFIKMGQFKSSYDRAICSRAVVFDDLINGNYSEYSERYFVGLQTFQNKIPKFLTDFGSINSTFSTVTSNSGPMKNILNQLGDVVVQITNIPSGSGKLLTLTYGGPLNVKKPTKKITSTFPTQLGSIDSPGSLIGQTYQQVLVAKKAIDKVAKISDMYMSIAGPSTHTIGVVQEDTQTTIDAIYELDKNLQLGIKSVQGGPYWVTVGSYVAFGLLIAFCLVGLVGGFFVGFFKNMSFRFIGYIAIIGLFILALLVFALTITTSLAVPTGFFACDFVRSSASNSQNFNDNFKKIIKNNKTRTAISKCLSSSSGTMLNVLSSDALVNAMIALPQALQAMTKLNTTFQSQVILDSFHNIQKGVKKVMEAKSLDIGDTAAIAILTKLSQSFQYKCKAPGFDQDSWIPSLQQKPQVVPCKFGIGAVADHTTCAMGDDFQQRASGCVGCIDSFGIFKYTGSFDSVQNALNKRYPGSTCTQFVTDLSNVWNNFYNVKQTVLGAVIDRYNSAKTSVELGATTLTRDVDPVFQQVIKQLKQIAPDFIDPKFGLGAGLSCSLIGQDMQTLSDNVCNMMLPRMYVMLIILGTLAFGLIFALCCLTCTISRHYDQSLKDQKTQRDRQTARSKFKSTSRSRVSTTSKQQLIQGHQQINMDTKQSDRKQFTQRKIKQDQPKSPTILINGQLQPQQVQGVIEDKPLRKRRILK